MLETTTFRRWTLPSKVIHVVNKKRKKKVSRGDWLWRPGNFKDKGYCLNFCKSRDNDLFFLLNFSLHHIFSTQHTLHEIQYIHYLQYNTIIYSTNNTNTILITLHTSNKTNTLKYIKKNFIRLPTNITH